MIAQRKDTHAIDWNRVLRGSGARVVSPSDYLPSDAGQKNRPPQPVNIDWQKLAPLLGGLATMLLAPKGSKGIAGGSYAGAMNALQQQEEQRKRQAWTDQLTQDEAARATETYESAKERDKAYAAWIKGIRDKLGAYAQDVPGEMGITETPGLVNNGRFAVNGPGRLTGGRFDTSVPAAPEGLAAGGKYQAPAAPKPDTLAALWSTPSIEGDKTAAAWADLLGPGAPEGVAGGAMNYLLGKAAPKAEAEAGIPRETIDTLAGSLSPDNQAAAGLYLAKTPEELHKFYIEALKYEPEGGPQEIADDQLKALGYTPQEIGKIQMQVASGTKLADAMKAVDSLKFDYYKENRDGGGGTRGSSGGGTGGGTLDDAALRAEYNNYMKLKGPDAIPFQDWLRVRAGEPTAMAYNEQTTGVASPSQASVTGKNIGYQQNAYYKETDWWEADRLVREAPSVQGDPKSQKGSITNAIYNAFLDPGVPQTVILALIDRYNMQNPSAPKKYGDWKAWVEQKEAEKSRSAPAASTARGVRSS